MVADQIQYSERIVAFIDILGFGKMIEQSYDSDQGKTNTDHLRKVVSALKTVHGTFDSDAKEYRNWEVTLFSDSAIVSFPYNAPSEVFHILLSLLHMNMELLRIGVVCRGAIVKGMCYHNNNVVFGPAVNEAYRLESKKSENPRIIIEKSVLRAGVEYHARHNSPEGEKESIRSLVALDDSDDWYFLNYFSNAPSETSSTYEELVYILTLKQVIETGLSEKDEKVFKKYQWMRLQFNQQFKDTLDPNNIQRMRNDLPELEEIIDKITAIEDIQLHDTPDT